MGAAKKQETKAQHTPGPWRFDPTERVGGYRVEAPGYGGIASTVQRDAHPTQGMGISWTRARANARLIAAAPEYDALLARLVEAHSQHNSGETFERIVRQIAIEARAALAKARGEG